MARIPYPPDEATGARPALNMVRMMSHAPEARAALQRFNESLRGGVLEPRLRELAILRVAHLSGTPYVWHQHAAVARRLGLDAAQIDAARTRAAADLPPGVETVLAFTDAVVARGTVDDATFESARREIGDRGLVELVMSTGMYMLSSRIAETFALDDDRATGTPWDD